MTAKMKRREFITLLGGATAAWPFAAHPQEAGRTYRLGFMVPLSPDSPGIVAFFDELRFAGFIEGQNLIVVPGGFDVRDERFAERAAAPVKAAPDAIVSGPDLTTRALQQATRTIPLIAMTEDMVAAGLVKSLARPGGNTTGISLLSPELDGKRQEILMDAVPGARRMAALADSRVTPVHHLQTLQEGAHARGVELSVFGVTKLEEIAPAIESAKASGAQALNVLATPLFFTNSRLIIERVTVLRLPAVADFSTSRNPVCSAAIWLLPMNARRLASGLSSRNNSGFLPSSWLVRALIPVTLPPGRARLATRPAPTASPPVAMTIGIRPVARFAAAAAGVFSVTITSTFPRTRSPAKACS